METENDEEQIIKESYWKCQMCGETVESNFDTCWNCQKTRTEGEEEPTVNEILQYNSESVNEIAPVDPYDYWKCTKCGQILDLNFDTCWNCGNNQPEEIEHPTMTDILQYQSVEEKEAMQIKSEDYWKCPKCGQTIEKQFDVCWNCQDSKPEITEQPTVNEILDYQSAKKPFDYIKSGFVIIGTGILAILFSGLTPISEELGFERTYYGRFIFGIFFVVIGIFFLIIGNTKKNN
jgi:uncharacterized OB-fold protein